MPCWVTGRRTGRSSVVKSSRWRFPKTRNLACLSHAGIGPKPELKSLGQRRSSPKPITRKGVMAMAKTLASFGSHLYYPATLADTRDGLASATASDVPDAVPANKSAPNLHLPFRERLGCSPREACAALGVGRTLLYQLISEGRIEVTKLRRRTIISVASLLRLMDAPEPKSRRRGRPRKIGSVAP